MYTVTVFPREVAAEMGVSAPRIPGADDHTPSSGVIDLGDARLDEERVDFVSYVQGPGDKVGKAAVIISIENPFGESGERIPVRIMHPVHCLESKLANRVTIGRDSIPAQTQLEATVPILREFVSEMLAIGKGDHRSTAARTAVDALSELAHYLRSDPIGNGRQIDGARSAVDPSPLRWRRPPSAPLPGEQHSQFDRQDRGGAPVSGSLAAGEETEALISLQEGGNQGLDTFTGSRPAAQHGGKCILSRFF